MKFLDRKKKIKILNPVRYNQDVSQNTRKRIRTLKMTLLAKAFFATTRGVIPDEGGMKFCRFEKREQSNVPGDKSFQLGEGTSENV